MSVIKFPDKFPPDPVEELLDELNAVENERLLEEIEELMDEDKTGRMATFIQFALRRYCAKLVVTGEPRTFHEIHVDCAQLVLSKWWSPLSRGEDVVDAIFDPDAVTSPDEERREDVVDAKVSVRQSKADIGVMLARYGAHNLEIFEYPNSAVIFCQAHGRHLRFDLPVPFDAQGAGSAWRAFFMSIKAKLQSSESGIEGFDEAFLAQIVTPSDQTRMLSQARTGNDREDVPDAS